MIAKLRTLLILKYLCVLGSVGLFAGTPTNVSSLKKIERLPPADQEYIPLERSVQNRFQRRNGYEGFRFKIFTIDHNEPDERGYVLIDFDRRRRWKITRNNAAALSEIVDYFEVSHEENRYFFGLYGEDFEVPISNRIAAQTPKIRGQHSLEDGDDVDPEAQEYRDQRRVLGDRMARHMSSLSSDQ